MKKLLFTIAIAIVVPTISNTVVLTNNNNINKNQNIFLANYNKYDKTTQFTVYNSHDNVTNIVKPY